MFTLPHILLPLIAGASPGASLPDVLRAIKERSPALLAARAETEEADAEVSRAWSAVKPHLEGRGTMAVYSKEATFDAGDRIEDVIESLGFQVSTEVRAELPQPVIIQPRFEVAGALVVSQSIFDLVVLRSPGAARARHGAAMARAGQLEEDLLFEGATLYVTLRGLSAFQAAGAKAFAAADSRLEDMRARAKAGNATALDVLRAEADRAGTAAERARAKARRITVASALGALMGAEVPPELDDQPIAALLGAPKEDRERLEIEARRLEVDAAERDASIQSMRWIPRVDLQGELRYANHEGLVGDRFLANAQVTLVLPLYDGGLWYADADVARARAERARRSLEQAKLDAASRLSSARAEKEASEARLEHARARLAYAEEAVAQAEATLAGGGTTELDLLDRDAERFQAQRSMAEAQVDVDVALLRLHYARGGSLAEIAK